VKVQLMLSVAALACGAAYAQDQATQDQAATESADSAVSSIFSQLDTNHDGKISSEEAQASSVVSRSFAKADSNGDGAIARDEFMAAFTSSRAPTTPPPAVPPSTTPPQ
jgi:Ca2+-binding EF-hand superfamily protein